MQEISILKKVFFGFCFFAFLLPEQTTAQTNIGKPSLGASGSPFTQACASVGSDGNAGFNDFKTSFSFSPDLGISPTNQFIIQMSDANGNFIDPITELFRSEAGVVTTSPATLSFAIPETTSGEGYKIRIVSTAPEFTSSSSDTFPAYYKIHDTSFTINNLVSTGAYCSGGSYLLTIDNPGTGSNISPLQFPFLTYNWYRELTATTSQLVNSGNTYTVTQEGTYFVKTNYGTCTSGSISNKVTITEATSGQADASIDSSLGNPFCPDQGLTTLSTLGGDSYQWYKDNAIIPDATNQMYQTDQSGTYSVQVDLGGCMASGEIVLQSELFDSSINIPSVNTIEVGETLTVIITDTAIAPQYTWFLNNVLISGVTQDTYTATAFGDYRVVIEETSGCTASVEFLFSIREQLEVEKIPNLISPNGDNVNDTWVLPLAYGSGTNTEVIIMTNRGEIVHQTKDYQNNWPEDQMNLTSINLVYYYMITTGDQLTKKGSITIVK